jgi:hypothetical protein
LITDEVKILREATEKWVSVSGGFWRLFHHSY